MFKCDCRGFCSLFLLFFFDFTKKMFVFLRKGGKNYICLAIVLIYLLKSPHYVQAQCSNPSRPSDYDYMITYVASIRRGIMHRSSNEDHVCSGSIISAKLILTTAECINRIGLPWMRLLYVVVGSSMRSSESLNSQYAEVKETRVHERYGKTADNSHDIGLIHLRQRLLLGCAANIVLLPGEPVLNATYSMVGWERFDGPYKDVLTIVSFVMPPPHYCMSHNSGLSQLFCGVAINLTQNIPMCVVESGTPLIHRQQVYGLATTNFDCRPGAVLMFTNVGKHLEWISDNGATAPTTTSLYHHSLMVFLAFPIIFPFV